jgi:acyl-coenzyme A thioesterase PaaI-like protein
MELTIERDSHCFCCGKDNEKGLHLTFLYPERGSAETSLEVPEYFQGWRKVTHGGFISTVLDEVMAHSCIGIAKTAVTAEITVKFKKPLETLSRIKIVGKVVGEKGRVLHTKGWVYDVSDSVIAEADARFVIIGAI